MSSIENALKAARQVEVAEGSTEEVDVVQNFDSDQMQLFVLSPRVKTAEEAMARAKVDPQQWEPAEMHVRSWEVGMKVEGTAPSGRKFTKGAAVVPLFGVFVKLRRKRSWNPAEFRELVLTDMRKQAPTYRRVKYPKTPTLRRMIAELSIADLHFGKLAWSPETRNSYDLRIAKAVFLNAAKDLIALVAPYRPERYLMIVGNDLLHVDSGSNTTTKGTPQDVDGRWQKSYLVARQCVTTVIEWLRQKAPVDVLVVPGNHDEEKLFCLGDAVECRFHHDDSVNVDNSPAKRKFYRYGATLLGFEHGHRAKKDGKDLPFNMMSEVPDLYAATTWREIHLGHRHSERETVWTRSHTEGDVIVRYLPSLSGTDTWHYDSGYRAPQAAEAHLYDYEIGRAGYFSVRPRMEEK